MKLEFKVPLKINSKYSTNKVYSGVHWAIRSKDKEYIYLLVRSSIKSIVKFDKPVSIKMSFNSNLDVSNHSYLFKMIEDSIKKLGILKDDNSKYVKQNILEKQKEFQGVVVTIKEI